MTFWGYLVLLFIIGCMIEDYQHTKHELEMERIRESIESQQLRKTSVLRSESAEHPDTGEADNKQGERKNE